MYDYCVPVILFTVYIILCTGCACQLIIKENDDDDDDNICSDHSLALWLQSAVSIHRKVLGVQARIAECRSIKKTPQSVEEVGYRGSLPDLTPSVW